MACVEKYQDSAEVVTSCPEDTDLVLFVDKTSGLAVFRTFATIKECLGGSATQKEPLSFEVGTDVDAPTAGQNTWVLEVFENSYVIVFINGFKCNQKDMGNGNPFVTKAALASNTITIGNYTGGFNNGDIVEYILITP